MPTTLNGFTYPAPFDVPDVPMDLQRLAEELDPFIPRYVKPTTTDTNATASPKTDAQLMINLPVGVYLIEANIAYACPNAAVDVQQTWNAGAGIGYLSRFVTGPEVAVSSTASQLMVHRPLSAFLTAQAFGIPATSSNYVRDELLVNVTVANALLRLQFCQNVSTPGVDVTRQTMSYFVVTRQGV